MRITEEMANEAFASIDIETKRWVIAIAEEMKRAKEKHPAFPADINHMALIMLEEAGETAKACIQFTYENGKFFNIHTELVQTGAMVMRMLTQITPPEDEDGFGVFISEVREIAESPLVNS